MLGILLPRLKYYIRFLNSIVILYLFKFSSKSKIVGIKEFQKKHKETEIIFVLAPGLSVKNLTKEDFNLISTFDNMGLSTFLLHDFICKNYLLEIGRPKNFLLEYLKSNYKKFKNASLFIKGYNSPFKIRKLIYNINALSEFKDYLNIEFLKDFNRNDFANDFIKKNIRTDKFINFGSTLISILVFLRSCEYKKIVLIGFDFSDKYFFIDKSKSLIKKSVHRPNSLSSDISRINQTKKELQSIAQSKEHFEIFEYKCYGLITELLPHFDISKVKKDDN